MPVLKEGQLLFRDVIKGTILATLFFIASSFIPVVGAVVIIFTPLPIFYYYAKIGRIWGMAVLCLSTVLVFLILHLFQAEWHLLIFVVMGLMGVMLAESFRRRYSIEKTVIVTTIFLTVVICSYVLYQSINSGQMPMAMVENYTAKAIQDNIRNYESHGVFTAEIGAIKKDLPKITSYMADISPALVLLTISLAVIISALAGRTMMQISKIPYTDFGDLTCWKAPEKLVWLLIVAAGSIMIPMSGIQIAGANILIICLFIYLIQGFSIISFVFKRKNVPLFIRFIFYFIIFAQQYLILIISALGLFDLWADFRKYVRMKDTTV